MTFLVHDWNYVEKRWTLRIYFPKIGYSNKPLNNSYCSIIITNVQDADSGEKLNICPYIFAYLGPEGEKTYNRLPMYYVVFAFFSSIDIQQNLHKIHTV